MKVAIVLFNLGGPDSLVAVRPFLQNLFSDRAIIALPTIVRKPLAWFIARKRNVLATMIYQTIGGRSPILEETQAQARALEAELRAARIDATCVIAMRYWKPFTEDAVAEVKRLAPDRIVLLPLYPQYSTTTTGSSVAAWNEAASRGGLPQAASVCCYPDMDGFVSAIAALIGEAQIKVQPGVSYRVLFSAHGLPKSVIERGDPYQEQVERTVAAAVARLAQEGLDYSICYQSRVGPMAWIGPSTEEEIRRAGSENKGVIVVPVAFVSEHSETLYELDVLYAEEARASGVRDYIRVTTVRSHKDFIRGLAELAVKALASQTPVNCTDGRICSAGRICGRETGNA